MRRTIRSRRTRHSCLGRWCPTTPFAHLTALGEAAVGISLTLGLLTELGAACGALQVIVYGLAVRHAELRTARVSRVVAGDDDRVFRVCAHAGRTWGLDGLLLQWQPRHPLDWRTRARRTSGARAALVLVLLLGIPASGVEDPASTLASNEGSGTVSVIEGTVVVATIPVGNRPRGLVVTRDGKHAYVALGKGECGRGDRHRRTAGHRENPGWQRSGAGGDQSGRTHGDVSNEALDSATAVAVDGHAEQFRVAVGKERRASR